MVLKSGYPMFSMGQDQTSNSNNQYHLENNINKVVSFGHSVTLMAEILVEVLVLLQFLS